jgi:hypothetical protein
METTTMTCMHNSLTPISLALAALLAASAITVSANAADTTYKEQTSVGQYKGWGDPAMAQIAVNTGRELVKHLRSARALLDEELTVEARSALTASRESVDAIERMMPYLLVVEEMMDASDHVVQEDVQALSTDLLPIYARLDEMAVYAPGVAHKTRGMVKQAENHAAAGDKMRAAEVLKQAAAGVTEHTVYLPVSYVGKQVQAALSAMNQSTPDLPAAKAAVDRALNSLTTVVDSVVETTARRSDVLGSAD